MMTLEEASEALQKFVDGYEKVINEEIIKQNGFVQAIKVVLNALRPINREWVEQMRGKFSTIRNVTVGERGELLFDAPSCSRCGHIIIDICNFCPSCGAPMTDEAVNMVMERLEALQ